ncbi:MFS transporter [Halostagnicola sp. A-GB9-2]|uniref:MFS transporter n=1 Tax=Halostagnicola sp. A-GB9-2 TaxID=3048066 RepID=UPI0024BF970F|nr:MFS transporter [Halostagnicola sp. A-GB9-2]MDJ1431966.1 MFS transporter [Halostagnicola sp. A-GB9-2]
MAEDPGPAEVATAAATFREERVDGEETLETLLTVDDEHETWVFDDLPVDSGTFGELVSRGLVTKIDGEYRVSNRTGVRAGLEGEEVVGDGSENDNGFELRAPIAFDPRAALALGGALVVLFFMRIVNYQSVFQGGEVVSPENDPYYYRHWMEELLSESDGVTDFGVIADMPDRAADTRPFTHAANWFFAELGGGGQWAADVVAAWLPVAMALVLGVVVYWLAIVVTDDVRVGVASVILLALTPIHAVYSGIGFLEHRPHQYLWLGVTLVTLAWLAVDLESCRESRTEQRTSSRIPGLSPAIRAHLRSPWTWVAAVVLGIALTVSAHTWGGSVLLFIPAAAYVGFKVAMDARADLSPALANAPVVLGLLIAGVCSASLHVRWGWHDSFIAIIPMLVFAGALGVIGLGELWRRLEWPVGRLVGLEGVLVAGSVLAFSYLRPENWATLRARADDVVFREGATETASLFALDQAVVQGPLAQLGVQFYVAVVVLGWACWIAYRRYEPAWLLLSTYVAFWLAMATFQVRFAAQLAVPLSVLGGFGLVYLIAWLDVGRLPAPFRERDETTERRRRDLTADGGTKKPSIVLPRDLSTVAHLALIGLIICGMSLVFAPSFAAQTAYDDAQVEATIAIAEHAEDVDREYPESYVLSQWGDNRMHNYFVNGHADGYSYADRNFQEFRTDDDPDGWYDQFEDDDVGYVVLTDSAGESPDGSAQATLHEELGAGGHENDGLEHYKLLYADDDATAFAIVPGATLEGPVEATDHVTVSTEVEVDGETVEYEREVDVGDDGELEVVVPYAGDYAVDGTEVTVDETAVLDGEVVEFE